MKNRILLFFLVSFVISTLGAILKINGSRDLGNAIMMIGAGLQLVTFVLWLLKSRSSKGNEAKS